MFTLVNCTKHPAHLQEYDILSDSSSEESKEDSISNATSSSEELEVYGDPVFALCLDLEQVMILKSPCLSLRIDRILLDKLLLLSCGCLLFTCLR